MDQVVRYAWMILVAWQHFLQNRAGLLLEREGFVSLIRRSADGKCIEDRRLIVLRILIVQSLHRLPVRHRTRQMRCVVRIVVIDG